MPLPAIDPTATTPRLDVLDELLARLRRIKRGEPIQVAAGGADLFQSTLARAYESTDAMTELEDERFPFAVVEDVSTTWTVGAPGELLSSGWSIGIFLAVKDDHARKKQNLRLWRLLEVLLYDVLRAITTRSANGGCYRFVPSAWSLLDINDERFGMGLLTVTTAHQLNIAVR